MTVFSATFEVNSYIGKLSGLLGHFDKKDTFFRKNDQNSVLLFDKCLTKSVHTTTV